MQCIYEKSLQRPFSALVGYKYISATRRNEFDRNLKIYRVKEMQEVIEKLWLRKQGLQKDTSK